MIKASTMHFLLPVQKACDIMSLFQEIKYFKGAEGDTDGEKKRELGEDIVCNLTNFLST